MARIMTPSPVLAKGVSSLQLTRLTVQTATQRPAFANLALTHPLPPCTEQPWLEAVSARGRSLPCCVRCDGATNQSTPIAQRLPVNLTYRHRLPASGPSVLSKLALASRNVAPLRCPTKPLLLKARQEGSASQAAASSPVVPYSGEGARLEEGEVSAPGRGGCMHVCVEEVRTTLARKGSNVSMRHGVLVPTTYEMWRLLHHTFQPVYAVHAPCLRDCVSGYLQW